MKFFSILLSVILFIPSFSFAAMEIPLSTIVKNKSSHLSKKSSEELKFYISAESGEIKKNGNNDFTLTLKGKNVKNVIYSAISPAHDVGSESMYQFSKYWNRGESFNKIPPNAALVATDKKNGALNLTYIAVLKDINYTNNDTVSFNISLLNHEKMPNIKKLWHIMIVIDYVSTGGLF